MQAGVARSDGRERIVRISILVELRVLLDTEGLVRNAQGTTYDFDTGTSRRPSEKAWAQVVCFDRFDS